MFVSIAVVGVTVFIIQRLTHTQTLRIRERTIHLAHAGLNHALYFFRFRDLTANGYFSLGQTNIDVNNFFVLTATPSDLLMVDTSTAALSPNGRELQNLRIQNATNSQTITIDRMIVSWVGVPANRRLNRIQINGQTVWTGNLATPADADITNFTLNTVPTIYPINHLRFNQSMAGATITVQFVMTDGSTRTLTAFPASNNYNFTVDSRGETVGSAIQRTLRADYNANTGRVINYSEL